MKLTTAFLPRRTVTTKKKKNYMIAHATRLKTFNIKQTQTNTILQNAMEQVEDIKNSSTPKWRDFSTTYIYYGFSN